MINCGILGYGKMGKIRHSAVKACGTKIKVTKVFDVVKPDNLDSEVCFCENENDILEDPKIDAIFICTPNFRIPELCITGLNAGKHVFSEKPPGFTATDVEKVAEAEKRAGDRKLMYGFNHRHHESIKKMKSIVDSGELGKILWMRGRYGKEVDEAFFQTWRTDPKMAGGGILLDQGIHMLDLFLHLGGGFDEVSAFVSNQFWKIESIEDNVFAIYRSTKTGISASLHSTMTQWRYLFSLEVFFEGGALILNGLKTSSGAYGDEILNIKRNPSHLMDGKYEEEESITYNVNRSWDSEILHFCKTINEDGNIIYGSSKDALALMKLIDQTYDKNL